MPLSAVDYSKIVIYRIFSDSHEFVYVGSTCNFRARKGQHKSRCNNPNSPKYDFKLYSTIRENGGFENWKMLQIEEYACENKRQAEKREQYWIDFYKPQLNTYKAFGCETKQEYNKQYYTEHAVEIKQYHIEHAEKIKEYQKQYHIEHKEQKKQYYIEHAEEIKEQQKQYLIEHAEEIKKQQSESIQCVCGSVCRKDRMSKHNRTLKHLAFIEKSNPAPSADDNTDSNSQNSTCSFL